MKIICNLFYKKDNFHFNTIIPIDINLHVLGLVFRLLTYGTIPRSPTRSPRGEGQIPRSPPRHGDCPPRPPLYC